MNNVKVTMLDEFTGETVVRIISDSNIQVAANAPLDSECNQIGNEAQQRKGLENWIRTRANQQHDTLLSLISWERCE